MRMVFDGFELDMDGGKLLRQGREQALERRALELLSYLASHPGRLIDRDELVREVWRLRQLSPGVLANTVAKLRKALGQEAHARTPLETLHGRGYRWHALPRPAASASEEPFVGRARVMELLDKLLERAARGEGKLVVLTGEAGIGKTRALRELARRAQVRGLDVWQGSAYEGAGAPPYWPWVEVLRAAHAQLPPDVWAACLPADATALAQLAPELFAAVPARADPQRLRFQLFDQLTRFLTAASARTPKLLWLDDLQAADVATVELLGHVARALSNQPLLLACSVRDSPPTRDQALLSSMQRLSRGARVITLRGLASMEIAELLRQLYGDSPELARAAEVLFERTRGNPFFVRQLLELLGEPISARELAALALPPAVRDVARQRMSALDGETRSVLDAASVLGVEFSANVVAEVLELGVEPVLAALEPARRLGLIERLGDDASQLLFAHALIREALYEELGLLTRGELHARVLAVSARRGAHDRRQLAELARHALAAIPCELESCLAHCARASDAARAASGFEAAANISERALDKLRAEGGSDAGACALSLTLGIDHYYAGDIERAWQALLRGSMLSRRELPELSARFAFRMLDCLEAGAGDEQVARAQLDHALSVVCEPNLRAALLAHRAEVAFELSFAERAALLDEADRLAEQGTPELLLEIANCRATMRHPAHLGRNREAAARLRALANAAGANDVRTEMRRFSAELTDYLCALTEGDLAAADLCSQRVQALAATHSPLAVRLVAELMLAGRAHGARQLEQHQRHIDRLRELSSGVTGGLAHAWLYHSVLLAEARGGLAEIAALLSALVLPDPASVTSSRHNTRALTAFAWVSVKSGDVMRARQLLSLLPGEELARMPAAYGDLGTLCQLAEISCALADADAARRLEHQLMPFAACNAVGPCLEYHGSVAHFLGLLARHLGQEERARAHFAVASQMNARLGI